MNTNASKRREAVYRAQAAQERPNASGVPSRPGTRQRRSTGSPADPKGTSEQGGAKPPAIGEWAWPLAWRIALINIGLFAAGLVLLILLGVISS